MEMATRQRRTTEVDGRAQSEQTLHAPNFTRRHLSTVTFRRHVTPPSPHSSGKALVHLSSFKQMLERTPFTPGSCASVPSKKLDRLLRSLATTLHT